MEPSSVTLLSRLLLCLLYIPQVMSERHCDISKLEVRSVVLSRYSRSNVKAILRNDGVSDSTCVYKLILPPQTLLSTLTIDLDNERFYGKVEKRKTKKNRKSSPPVTVDNRSQDTNNVTIKTENNLRVIKITNLISKRSSITITVGYERLLQRKKGMYNLVLYVPQKPADVIKTTIVINENEPIVSLGVTSVPESTSPDVAIAEHRLKIDLSNDDRRARVLYNGSVGRHRKQNSSQIDDRSYFAVTYDIHRQPDGGELKVKDGYFVHFFCPEGFEPTPQHTVFVLDISGSMKVKGKMQHLKKAMLAIIQTFRDIDSFEIIVFSTRYNSLGTFNGTSSGIKAATSQVKRLKSFGGTNINNALLRGIKGASRIISQNRNVVKQIMFLTDGKATVNETDPEKILKNVQYKNIQNISIHALALGTDADIKFLKKLASKNDGSALLITNLTAAADQLKLFYDDIASPLLSDLSISYPQEQVDPDSIVRKKRSIFYSGDEVVTSGKLRDGVVEVTPEITGTGHTGKLQFNVSRVRSPNTSEPPAFLNNSELPRLWAYMAVKDMLYAQDYIIDPAIRFDLRARALDIGLKYNFVTRFTSLTIVEVPRNSHHGPDDPSDDFYKVLESKDFDILTEEALYASLPTTIQRSLNTSYSRKFNFVENDPHFVVHVTGVALPLCFDIHGKHGDVFSLIRDPVSGVVVNGEVGSAKGRPNNTYFTRLYISLGEVNITVTPDRILVDHQKDAPLFKPSSIWPFNSQTKRRSKYWTTDRRSRGLHKRRKRKRQKLKRRIIRSSGSVRLARHPRVHSIDIDSLGELQTNNKGNSVKNYNFLQDFQIRDNVNNVPKSKFQTFLSKNEDELKTKSNQINFMNQEPSKTQKFDSILLEVLSSVENLAENIFHLKNSETTFETVRTVIKQFIEILNAYYLDHKINTDVLFLTANKKYFCVSVENINNSWKNLIKILQSNINIILKKSSLPDQADNNNGAIKEIIYIIKQSDFHNFNKAVYKATKFDCESNLKYLVEVKTHLVQLQQLLNHLLSNKLELTTAISSTTVKTPFLKKLSWRRRGGFRYGDVVVTLEGRRLHIVKGDLAVHLTVTHSTSKRGQQFLGFYIQQQNVLSPSTTGILGQFVFKSVGTRRSSVYPHKHTTDINDRVELTVLHTHPHKTTTKVSEVTGFVKRRRSLLHKKKVSCIHIGQEGKGLLYPTNYKLPCLNC